MIHLKKSLAALITVLATVGCTPQDEPSPSPTVETQNEAKGKNLYCALINPETVQPLGGGDDVRDFGGPVAKKPSRNLKCALYDAKDNKDLLSVFTYEVAPDRFAAEDAKFRTYMAKVKDAEYYVDQADADSKSYAWFTGDTAAASILTSSRNISVAIPASEVQAETFVPLALAVAEEVNANLDAWDEANPAE